MIRVKVLQRSRLGGVFGANGDRRVGLLAEHGADYAGLGPDLGIERRTGRLHDADDDPTPLVQGKRVADVESVAVARGGRLRCGATAAQVPGNRPAEHDLDGGSPRVVGRGAVRRRFHAGVGEPFPEGLQGNAMHHGGHLRVLDAAKLESPPFRLAGRGVGNRLVDDEEDFAACQGAAERVAGDARLMIDVPNFHRLQVAEHLVGRPVGENHHVVRMARGLRQCVHAIDEGQHDGEQGDDEGKGQGGHQRRLPPQREVAEVVAQWDFPQQQQDNNQEDGRRGGDRQSGSEGKHGLTLSPLPPGEG